MYLPFDKHTEYIVNGSQKRRSVPNVERVALPIITIAIKIRYTTFYFRAIVKKMEQNHSS